MFNVTIAQILHAKGGALEKMADQTAPQPDGPSQSEDMIRPEAGRLKKFGFSQTSVANTEEQVVQNGETSYCGLRHLVSGVAERGKNAFSPDRRSLLKDLFLLGLCSHDLYERRTLAASHAQEEFPDTLDSSVPSVPDEAVDIATLFNASLPVHISLKTLPASRLPNAARAYRQGRHEGIDLYVPYESTVVCIADGIITRADQQFVELNPELHRLYLAESAELKTTPPDVLDRLRGRCVEIDHGVRNGVRWRSVYAHLSEVQVAAGARILEGEPIGKVGNSGTTAGVRGSRDDAHLHLEIRMQRAGSDETYLGQGLSEPEVRRLLEEIFCA